MAIACYIMRALNVIIFILLGGYSHAQERDGTWAFTKGDSLLGFVAYDQSTLTTDAISYDSARYYYTLAAEKFAADNQWDQFLLAKVRYGWMYTDQYRYEQAIQFYEQLLREYGDRFTFKSQPLVDFYASLG